MGRILRRVVVVVGLLLWVVVPVVCVVVVRGRADRLRLHGNQPTSVEAIGNTQERVSDAGLRLSWATHSPVVAPMWTGTVTAIGVAPGDEAIDGGVALTIDGVDRVLVASTRPFSRPLALDDVGADVAALNDLLRRRNLPAGPADRFVGATERGVTEFARSIGAGPAIAFDPAWVLFLSSSGARIATVSGTVGAPAPPAGETVLALAPDLVGATVIPHQDQPPDAAAPSGDAEATSQPSGAATAAALDGIDPIEVPAGSVVRLDATDLVLAEDRRSIAGRSLRAIQDLAGTAAPYLDVAIAAPPATGELIVPAAAVIADQQGGTCVRRVGARRSGMVTVRVLGGDSGQTVVAPVGHDGLGAADRVEVAVPAGERSCR